MSRKIEKLFFLIAVLWNIFIFVKIPHLPWSPGYLGTWFMSKNLVISKDFVQTHFPFAQFIEYLPLKLTHWNLLTEPILALIVSLTTLYLLSHFGRKYLKPTALAGTYIFFSLYFWFFSTWVQFSEEMLIGTLLLWVFFQILEIFNQNRFNQKQLFLIGLVSSSAFFTGQIASLTVVVFMIFMGFIILKKSLPKKNVWQNIKPIIFGLSLPLVVTLIYFAAHSALGDFIYWNFGFYFDYAKMIKNSLSSLPWREIIFFALPILLLGFNLSIGKNKIIFRLTFITGVTSLILAIAGLFHFHHFLHVLPIGAFSFGLIINTALENKSKFFRALVAIYFIAFIGYSLQILLPWHLGKFHPGLKIVDLTAAPNRYQDDIQNWVSNHTNPTAKITVVGDPLIYLKTNRLPANKYFSALPWHYLPLANTQKVFASSPPDYWVVEANYMKRLREGWKTPQVADFIQNQVTTAYKKVYANSEWEVWQHSDF